MDNHSPQIAPNDLPSQHITDDKQPLWRRNAFSLIWIIGLWPVGVIIMWLFAPWSKITKALITVTGLIIFIPLIYFLIKLSMVSSDLHKNPTKYTNSSLTASPTTPQNITENWKTYTDKSGFELKYPADWQYISNHSLTDTEDLYSVVIAEKGIATDRSNIDGSYSGLTVQIDVQRGSNRTLEKARNDDKAFAKSIQDISIGGKEAIEMDTNNLRSIIIFNNNTEINIKVEKTVGHDGDIYEKIIQSFNFTAQDTSNWKVYLNNNPAFSFNYPNDFQVATEKTTPSLYIHIKGAKETFTITLTQENTSTLFSHNATKENEVFNNLTWHKVPSSEYCDAGSCGILASGYTTRYGKYIIDFSIDKGDDTSEIAKTILSTFKIN